MIVKGAFGAVSRIIGIDMVVRTLQEIGANVTEPAKRIHVHIMSEKNDYYSQIESVYYLI